MKRIKKLMAVSLVTIFAVSISGCSMIAKTDAAIKKSPVAKVNSEIITKAQLDERMTPVIIQMQAQKIDVNSEQGKQTIAEEKKKMLDTMVTEDVIVQKAKELKIMPTEAKLTESVNKKMADVKKGFLDAKGMPDEAKFKAALAQAGFTEASLKEYLKIEEITTVAKDYAAKDVKIDDVKAKAEYDANSMKYTEKPNTIHVTHILLKTEAEAKAVKTRLDNKEDFAKVAKEVSTEPAAKESGGDLPEFDYAGVFTDGSQQSMDKTFVLAAMSLKPGAISNPVKTQFGFHIIKCIDKKEYPTLKFDAVKEKIKTALLESEKTKAATTTLDKWKKAAKIETAKYVKNL